MLLIEGLRWVFYHKKMGCFYILESYSGVIDPIMGFRVRQSDCFFVCVVGMLILSYAPSRFQSCRDLRCHRRPLVSHVLKDLVLSKNR